MTRAELVAQGVPDPDADHRLRPLCTPCHNEHGLSYKPWAKRRTNSLVTVVSGPPCAGKNTYIAQHAQPGDVVVDYDAIMQALTGTGDHDHDAGLKEQAHAIRDRQIATLLASNTRGWIISTSPKPARRHTHGCRVVLLLPTQATALRRAQHERPPEWQQYIRSWYQQYEPDTRDTVIYT